MQNNYIYKKIEIPKIRLSDGNMMPVIGLGTSEPANNDHRQLINVIKYALRIGYRHIDTAWISFHNATIGRAIKEVIHSPEHILKRDELFVVCKLWNTFHSKEMVPLGLSDSMKNLNLDYLDLLYMNWPIAFQENCGTVPYPRDSNGNIIFSEVSFIETYQAMEDCVKRGKVRSLGLANFNIAQIQEILAKCSIRPAVVQVESNPYFQNKKLINFCQNNGITVVTFSPHGAADLAKVVKDMPSLLDDEVLVRIGEKHGRTAAQVCIRWSLQRGCVPIAKANEPEQIWENSNVFDFELSWDDMQKIDEIEANFRIFKGEE